MTTDNICNIYVKLTNEDIDVWRPVKVKSGKTITYNEFDINNVKPRDSNRFVRGSDGNVYYTNDHYKTFTKVEK